MRIYAKQTKRSFKAIKEKWFERNRMNVIGKGYLFRGDKSVSRKKKTGRKIEVTFS